MTDKFIPPPPSDEVLHRLDAGEREMFATEFSVGDCMRAGRMMREALAAAFAHDLPRVCRAEVEEMLDVIVVGHPWRGCGCYQCVNYRLYLTERYGPPSDGPAPEPVESPASHPGIADVVALQGTAAGAVDCCADCGMAFTQGVVTGTGKHIVVLCGRCWQRRNASMSPAANIPHLCDRPETLAFLRDVAMAMENQYLGSARRFLDATREAE